MNLTLPLHARARVRENNALQLHQLLRAEEALQMPDSVNARQGQNGDLQHGQIGDTRVGNLTGVTELGLASLHVQLHQ